ncbi:MarR family winged helix-turn-helix transcriptional regulator [Saccharibacillus sacchari]|uniref:MarR family winged helix-turn-helix transcriptional regulator n=1 Tax=Saccharibacillus sacchari TaxID=456493 RepID=A0ACC6PA91_9BACL
MKEVLREVEAIARCSEAISSIEFKHLKLSRGLHLYLTFICENPGEPAGTVPDRLKVKRAAASRALQKLEDEGLIVLREAPNLRKDKRVYPTETGKSAYLFIQDEGEYSDESSLRGLSPDETAQLLDMLYRVRLNVEKDWRFVQKGGRRPYIHDYYNRLIAAEAQEPDFENKHNRAESPQASAKLEESFSEPKESTGPAGQVSLWTYEESAEQDAKRSLEEEPSADRETE